MGGILKELGAMPIAINGPDDHVHGLAALPATLSVADAMRVVKTNSSRRVHEQWPHRRAFAWQTGYGAFSVSRSNRDEVERYIANQEEHHKHVTFQEEFLAFLKRHGRRIRRAVRVGVASSNLTPLRGWTKKNRKVAALASPRLTPWATFWRPSGADVVAMNFKPAPVAGTAPSTRRG